MKSGTRRWAWVVVAGLAVTGVAAVAAEEAAAPTTRPVAKGEGATSRPWKLAKRLAAGSSKVEEPTDEEWKAVVEFMGENSPNRLKAIQELRAGERGGNLRKAVWGHYRDLQGAKERGDQELYDLKLAVVKADDELWGLQRQLREAPESERPVLRRPVREKLAEVIKLGLKERAVRIARLEKGLAEEKEQLAADEQNVGLKVEERMRAMFRPAGAARAERRGDGSGATTVEAVGSQVK